MKRQTIEAEVLDRQLSTHSATETLAWQALDSPRQPDEIAIEHEEGAPDSARRAVDGHRRETLMAVLSYVLRDFERNGSAMDVGRRVIAIAKFIEHRALGGWSATELAKACGETPASMSDRVRRECNQIIETMGGVAQARWQQGPAQRQVSAAAQLGNRNRANSVQKDS